MSSFNLKIPPVALGLIALVLIWLSSRYLPISHISFAFTSIVSLVIICIGVFVGVIAVAAFLKMRTTVDPRYPQKANTLVVIGIYKYSRNPMYLAITFILFGISLYLAALSSFLILILFVAYINRFQIIPEEQALEKKFGEQYSQYIKRVRRWI